MPRPSNTQQRREEIALALARVMARTGYDRATVAAVAREAGVPTGSIHYHFASKHEILVDLVGRVVAAAEARIAVRTTGAGGGRGELLAILDGLLDTRPDRDPRAVGAWSLISAEAARNEEVRRIYGDWVGRARDRLRTAFAAACRDEGRRARGASRVAGALIAMVEGYYTVGGAVPTVIPAGSAAPTARGIAVAMLERQPPRSA